MHIVMTKIVEFRMFILSSLNIADHPIMYKGSMIKIKNGIPNKEIDCNKWIILSMSLIFIIHHLIVFEHFKLLLINKFHLLTHYKVKIRSEIPG